MNWLLDKMADAIVLNTWSIGSDIVMICCWTLPESNQMLYQNWIVEGVMVSGTSAILAYRYTNVDVDKLVWRSGQSGQNKVNLNRIKIETRVVNNQRLDIAGHKLVSIRCPSRPSSDVNVHWWMTDLLARRLLIWTTQFE